MTKDPNEPPAPAFPEDVALARRALQGSDRATEELAQRLACIPSMIRARARTLGGHLDGDAVNELSQEVLITVWSRLGTYAGDAPLEGWVHAFVARFYLRALHRGRAASRFEEWCPAEHACEEDETVTLEDEYQALHNALGTLRSTQAFIVRQRHFEQRTFDDIAAELQMPRATVKTKYYRGIERLRERLAGFWGRRLRARPRLGRVLRR